MNSAGVLDEPYFTIRYKEAAGVMSIIGLSDNQFTFDVMNDKTTRLSYCVCGCVCGRRAARDNSRVEVLVMTSVCLSVLLGERATCLFL